ncbi:MAG: hypothetical protein IAE89_09545 [Anaerolineae bacterium]|nr:hypothetical protein [Anaerolineae bacterium]
MPARFENEEQAITYIFRSMRKLRGKLGGPDELTRDVAPTVRLLTRRGLLANNREYAVVTGSKGKGSTTAMTANILRHLGHTTGMISSPHLVTWRERVRVNGRAISEADLCRILNDLAPDIDEIEATLSEHQYFSPQGIFLAIALAWFDEMSVNAAVLEVGRGGRFDDIATVPNKLSLFTPIMLEHPHQLGPTVERIAWHKAGIIKPYSYAYSVTQATEVLNVLQTEADALDAEFFWLAAQDTGVYLGDTATGLRMSLTRYGEIDLPLHGRYQVQNATLAVQGAGNMHARLPGIAHGSAEYVERVREGLSTVIWPGRMQKLQDSPLVFVDGAVHGESASALVHSLQDTLTDPVIAIVGIPEDKDFVGVYKELGIAAETLILTETPRNVSLTWPERGMALETARRFNDDSRFAPDLPAALDLAKSLAGKEGTILIVGTQSIVADTIQLYGLNYEQI